MNPLTMQQVEAQLAQMSVEQKLGQMFCISMGGTQVDQEFIRAVRTHCFGNVNLFGQNIQTPAQVRTMTQHIQQTVQDATPGVEALITVDEEGGSASQFSFGFSKMPGNFALGAADDEASTRVIGQILGNELRDLGFNMLFGPVLDLCRSPLDRIIGTRAFGDNPHRTARLGLAFAQGVEMGGCGCTFKHFPGHGAPVMRNDYPINLSTEAELLALDAYPFAQAIQAGAQSIMVGHIALPSLHDDGDLVPASLSSRVINGLLREKMGFGGVVIADGAVADRFTSSKAAMAAFNAGVDIVVHQSLNYHITIYKALMNALKKGRITESALDGHARRILLLKAHVKACFAQRKELFELAKSASLRQILHQGMSLLRDPGGLVPLPTRYQRGLVISPQLETFSVLDGNSKEINTFGDHLALLFPHAQVIQASLSPSPQEVDAILAAAQAADVVLIGSENANEFPRYLEMINALCALRPTVVISLRSAYEATAIDSTATVIGAFTRTNLAMGAVAGVLAGRRPPMGSVPISLG